MILKELIKCLDKIFQVKLAEEWDNAGHLVGNGDKNVNKILIALDVDEELIEEAKNCGAELIISHHPPVFEPIRSVTDTTPTGSRILKLIQEGIAVYSAHTNYDIMENGLNNIIVQKLGLTEVKPISSYKKNLYKLIIFVPTGTQDEVRKAICSNGGGRLGDYSCCTFSSSGKGTFIPGKKTDPYIGETGELSIVDEVRIECIVEEEYLEGLLKEALKAHPYEEPAYDLYKLENRIMAGGLAKLGMLANPVTFNEFIGIIKKRLDIDGVGWIHRGIEDTGNRIIEKVAIAPGSSNSLTEELAVLDCDLVLTGEISYHNGIRISETGKIIAVVGHGTIERYFIDGAYDKVLELKSNEKLDIEVLKSKSGYWTWRYDIGRC